MAARWAREASPSSGGRYMMMPTHECTVARSPPGAEAGLIGDELDAVQRCSMGAGAAIPRSSMRSSRRSM